MNFYFYDLETTGFNSREGRIMQFGGQRTTLDLKPIGAPDNFYIKLTNDILPDPTAVLITKITPQKTIAEGLTEAEFMTFFNKNIVKPGTIFIGFNNIRFDDEFMRHILYRNFYDPYEWQWQNDSSRWDLLDVTRMTRSLRPAGIKWPFDSDGSPSNQLGLLTKINNIDHLEAHDALSDVNATIALAHLIRLKQPKLFDYLLSMRQKSAIADLVTKGRPFVYTSGKYPSEYLKTTVVSYLIDHPKRQAALVYDLRQDPTPFYKLSPAELVEVWQRRDPAEGLVLPIKTLQYNRCPAIAPLTTLDKASQERLKLDITLIKHNAKILNQITDWQPKLLEALEILDVKQQERLFSAEGDVDNQLYDHFFTSYDKQIMNQVRRTDPVILGELTAQIKDPRLMTMVPLYKARNFFNDLSKVERQYWDNYRRHRLLSGDQNSRLSKYLNQVQELETQSWLSKEQKLILDELRLYGENILNK